MFYYIKHTFFFFFHFFGGGSNEVFDSLYIRYLYDSCTILVR